MAKTRIYELARALNMTNKALLSKLEELGIEAKSHMSSLNDDEVGRIKANIFHGKAESADVVEQKRVRSNVIRKRRQPAMENPESEASAEEEAREETGKPAEEKASPEPAAGEEEEIEAPAQPEASAEPDNSAPAEGPEEEETEEAAEPDKEETPTEAAEPESIEPESPETIKAEKTEEKEKKSPETEKSKKKPRAKKHQAAKIIKFPEKQPAPAPEEPVRTPGPAKTGETVTTAPAAEGKGEKPAKKTKKKKKHAEETPEGEDRLAKKKSLSKRKEIIEGVALYDRTRGRMRKKGKGKSKAPSGAKPQITTPKAIKRKIKIYESITVAELAKRMGIKANEIIGKLMGMGVMATVNQSVDFDTAALVATEFDYEVEHAAMSEQDLLKSDEVDAPESLKNRAPVVTIMGHVDHGKTSLLDVIRKSSITDGEAGGITQHIGAYKVDIKSGAIVFLDTPGHEAFTAMRARGAQATDIVVLVVAADDGVMPQTIEAINHSRAAGVPIVVAVNKIDKDNADIDRVKREISENGLIPEDWGGDTIFVPVSAKQQMGLEDLMDMILLQSEMLELKANPDKHARGIVVESKLDPGRGPVATVLIQEGTLNVGEAVVCGIHYGKIRAMLNDKGDPIDTAGPSTPVEVLGLTGVATAGDEFVAIGDEKNAKLVSQQRSEKQRTKELARSNKISLENFFEQMQTEDVKHLNIIIKADVNGSCEAIADSLKQFSSDEVKINIIHAAPGAITESDVSLASASDAIVLGFNTRPAPKVRSMANEEQVDIRSYDVIYDLIDDVKDAITGMMESRYEEHVLGRAEVRDLFVIPKKGTIAGSYVLDGIIVRGKPARLIRDSIVIHNSTIGSLRRFKEDAKEVKNGYECGIGLVNYNDLKLGDIIECYDHKEIKPEL
ncbi:MAG: translation initiation factor IF-2 [Thermodesulfobacteriota bacterium]|nr:translation initiation factor IF-2 [Thermodesulfobacteriota bacterium]